MLGKPAWFDDIISLHSLSLEGKLRWKWSELCRLMTTWGWWWQNVNFQVKFIFNEDGHLLSGLQLLQVAWWCLAVEWRKWKNGVCNAVGGTSISLQTNVLVFVFKRKIKRRFVLSNVESYFTYIKRVDKIHEKYTCTGFQRWDIWVKYKYNFIFLFLLLD